MYFQIPFWFLQKGKYILYIAYIIYDLELGMYIIYVYKEIQ